MTMKGMYSFLCFVVLAVASSATAMTPIFTLYDDAPSPINRSATQDWQADTAHVCLQTQRLDPAIASNDDDYTPVHLLPGSEIPVLAKSAEHAASVGFEFSCGNCHHGYADWQDNARYFMLNKDDSQDSVEFRFPHHGTRHFLAHVWLNGGTAVDVYCDEYFVGSIVPEYDDLQGYFLYSGSWGFSTTTTNEPYDCHRVVFKGGDRMSPPEYGGDAAELFLWSAQFSCQIDTESAAAAAAAAVDDSPEGGSDPPFQRRGQGRRELFSWPATASSRSKTRKVLLRHHGAETANTTE